MADPFQVDHIDIDRLLGDWRWLCPKPVTLVARNAFGDLFLREADGNVVWLNVAEGKLTNIAPSVAEFCELLTDKQSRAVARANRCAKSSRTRP